MSAHSAPPATGASASPRVTKSKAGGLMIQIVMFIITLIVVTQLYNRSERSQSFDMNDMPYGTVKAISIAAYSSASGTIPDNYTTFIATGVLQTIDAAGVPGVFEFDHWSNGKNPINPSLLKFNNKTDQSIILKSARFQTKAERDQFDWSKDKTSVKIIDTNKDFTFIGLLIGNLWAIIAMLGLLLLGAWISPMDAFKYKLHLWLVGILAVIAFVELWSFSIIGSWNLIIPFGVIIFCMQFIKKGFVAVSFNTQTAVNSNISNQSVGFLKAGTHSLNPLSEFAGATPNKPGTAIDLRNIIIHMESTDWFRTAKAGVLAYLGEISVTVHLISSKALQLQNIKSDDPIGLIEGEIIHEINEAVKDEAYQIDPDALEENRANILQSVKDAIREKINHHCLVSRYPFEVEEHTPIIVGDVVLEEAYENAIAGAALAMAQAKANRVSITELSSRMEYFKSKLEAGLSDAQKNEMAMLAERLVTKTISEEKWDINKDAAKIIEKVATILAAALAKKIA